MKPNELIPAQAATKNEKPKKSRSKKRRFSKVLVAVTVLLQIIVSLFLTLMLVVHGPFDVIRTYIIGTAMGSYRHQYIAKLLFSPAQISKVLGKSQKSQSSESAIKVVPKSTNDATITEEQITSSNGSYSGYLLEIANPLRLKVAMTKNLYKSGQATSVMASDNNAIAAINGGGFYDVNWTGTGSQPSGFVIQNGQVTYKNVSEDTQYDIVIAIDAKGSLIVGSYSINDLMKLPTKIMYAVTYDGDPHCALIKNGKGIYNSSDGTSAGYASRTAIGQKNDGSGTIIMLVLDGYTLAQKGASLWDVQNIMQGHGAYVAACLDGGNSSTMYYKGAVINTPRGETGERPVATAFYIGN